METFIITGITEGASSLAAKLNRNGYEARVCKKTNVIAVGSKRPWAILNGYNTRATQVVSVGEYPSQDCIDDAIARYGI